MLLKNIGNCHLAIEAGSININHLDGTIKKLSLCAQPSGFMQLCPLDALASVDQLFFAAEQALDAFAKGTNFSRQLGLEFLLRLSGARQIGKAIEKLGLRSGSSRVVLVAAALNANDAEKQLHSAARSLGFRPDSSLFKGMGRNAAQLRKLYGIRESPSSLLCRDELVSQAVIEKIAMVATEE